MKKKSLRKSVYHYTAIFEPDQEAGGYTVTIPELPGCLSEGDTFEDAMKNIKEAAELYLEVARQQRTPELFRRESHAIVAPVDIVLS